MHGRTAATLADLDQASWFSCVGVKDAGDDIVVVSSWQEAIRWCSSLEWENLCLEAFNRYMERLVERAPERFERWNQTVAEVKEVVVPFVERKIQEVVERNHLPKVFEDTVQGDIVGVCMEAEYADVFPPGFYAASAYWYTIGHFPCGWEGAFPKGTRIIF